MASDPRVLLYDVAAGCSAIRQFCRNRELQDYEADQMLRSACERQFEIVGGAMTHLLEVHRENSERRGPLPCTTAKPLRRDFKVV